MAEVLITLAIIGIVAAITIPSIVANHQKKALETQFAKTYRTLLQAVNLAIAEHGDMGSWDWSDSPTKEGNVEFFKKYFAPYLNITKLCTYDGVKGCFPDTEYLNLSGNPSNHNFYKSINTMAQLADGTSVYFFFVSNCLTNNTRCGAIYVDINGHKKPNTIGLDLYAFDFYPQTSEFIPNSIMLEWDDTLNKYVKNDPETIRNSCTRQASGWACGARIILDGFKMNY